MSNHHFAATGSNRVEALNLTVNSYRHLSTGARHLHLAADDDNNAFAVAFLTVPSDSTGVAHILEHTSLCGSERFPVRDPFFNMLKRSLNTFMNAFTANDWTAYPFASQNATDFDNLLQVYLDAVFFPALNPLDFAQEGHRLEPENAADIDGPLVLKGVVYNEMKGAMSPPISQVQRTLQAQLFPTTTYHHNSGGDPAAIPDLTYEQLVAFHRRHYHPSNALFLTYGNFPVAHHQSRIHDLALSRFKRLTIALSVPDEKRYEQPIRVRDQYSLDTPLAGPQTHVLIGWLLGDGCDLRTALQAHLLHGVLMEHSGSPLRAALETTALGTAPSELCGIDDSTREMTFAAGLEGADAENTAQIEALILDVLGGVALNGVPAAEIRATLHQLELSQREVGGDHFPYGLGLMLRAMGPALHGGDPVAALDIDDELERLSQKAEDPQFIKELVRTTLLANQHRVTLTMVPNITLSQQREQAVKERLGELQASLSAQERQQLAHQASALEARQNAEDDTECLPTITTADVPGDIRIPTGTASAADGYRQTWYGAGTNGLVYGRIVATLPALAPELLALLPLYCDLGTEVGCAHRDYRANQAYQAAVAGGIDIYTSTRGHVSEAGIPESYFIVAGKALARNSEGLAELLTQTYAEPRFDEPARVRELIAQLRAQEESRVTDTGHSLAMMAAAADLTATAALNEQWSGLTAIKALKALDDSLCERATLEQLCAQLTALRDRLIAAPKELVLVSEHKSREVMQSAFARYMNTLPCISARPEAPAEVPVVDARSTDGPSATGAMPQASAAPLAWLVNTQVNFCAKAFRAASYGHEDAAPLYVLASLLRNEFLHRELREKGGAYGGGASYDPNTGVFSMFSYRDPRLIGTLRDFDRAVDWAVGAAGNDAAREQAILGVISAMDRPASPAGEALGAHLAQLHGRSPALRRALRAQVLQVDAAALRRCIDDYLHTLPQHIAVVTNAKELTTLDDSFVAQNL